MRHKLMTTVVAAIAIAGAGETKCVIERIAALPVTMLAKEPTIQAGINGREARFLISSGLIYSVLSPEAVRENKLPLYPAPFGWMITESGRSVGAQVARVKAFTLAKANLPDVAFLVGSSELGNAGLLGQNLLHVADVEYDLPHGMVSLFKPAGCVGASLAHWVQGEPYSVLPLENNGERLSPTQTTVLLNGERMRALLDTGSRTSIISTAAAARLGITPTSPGVTQLETAASGGGARQGRWIVPIATATVGGETLRNARLVMRDLGGRADMLIGADFFLSHRIYVANSQNKLYFTYVGGGYFDAGEKRQRRAVDANGKAIALVDRSEVPTDAAGLARQGMAQAARGEEAAGIAALDKAIAAAPDDAALRLQRARLLFGLGRMKDARADVDKALALRPDDADARINRAAINRADGDKAAAERDLDAAAALLDPASNTRLRLAGTYDTLDLYEKAIVQYDQWIAAHPADNRRASALNGACWARALANRELPRALADCTTALKTHVNRAQVLDSRGLVYVRMERWQEAARDYDAALALRPGMAWSLYGRGIAKLRMGNKAGGEADLAEAAKRDAALRAEAAAAGLVP